jgi:CubicO group peptidase (beta-lactamase class C family)
MPNRIVVPRNLSSVSQLDYGAECDPREVGMSRGGVDRIWRAVEAFYRTGLQPAIALVLRRHGRIVLRRAIGHACGNGPGEGSSAGGAAQGAPVPAPVPVTADTPICLYSASKAVSAMLIHKLAERGRLGLDDRVTDYLPEYGAHRKGDTTIRHLLAHRAGIPQIAIADVDPRLLFDWDGIVRLLCQARPVYRRDSYQAYHAITAGFILGEIARRVGNAELPQLVRRWIAAPLGARHMTYGLSRAHRGLAARDYFTGRATLPPVTLFAKRILGVSFERVVELANDPAFQSTVIPAGNMYASADEMSRFFQMLLDGGTYEGRRLFRAGTVAEAIRPYDGIRIDRTFFLPLRFSAGMVLGQRPFGLYGPDAPQAFGHLGFMTSLCWADPQRDIAVAFLNTGKSLSVPALLGFERVVATIGMCCPKLGGRRR